MKKSNFLLLVMALVVSTVMLFSCSKDSNTYPTNSVGKMLLPQVELVQGSNLVTKAADIPVNKITYEFWVKSGSVWVLAGKELFKDGSVAQTVHGATWSVSYPNSCTTCFIEVPLGMQTRIVAKVMKDDTIKFYGIFETPANGFEHIGDQISTISIKAFEINSRLRLDVTDVAKNTNFDFVFNFTGTVKNVDYSSIVQGASSWVFTSATSNRNFNLMPLTATGTTYTKTFSILGKGVVGSTPDYKLNNATFPSAQITTVGTKTYFEIYEYFGQGSNDSKVSYSITRKNDGVAIKTNHPITATGTRAGFATNWLQAGYNFTITIYADPQALGRGCFTTTLIDNTEITGTVTL